MLEIAQNQQKKTGICRTRTVLVLIFRFLSAILSVVGGAGRLMIRSPTSPSSGTGVPPSPPGGKASFGCADLFCYASQLYRNLTFKSALSLSPRNDRSSLPPGGEGGTPVPDEGETGERNFYAIYPSLPREPSIPPRLCNSGSFSGRCRIEWNIH